MFVVESYPTQLKTIMTYNGNFGPCCRKSRTTYTFNCPEKMGGRLKVQVSFFHFPFLSYLLFAATKDEKKKAYYRNKISSYMNRAEGIKKCVVKEKEGTKL